MKKSLNSPEAMMFFMESWLLAKEGKDPSEAIEFQEKRGQANVIKHKRLPKKLNQHLVPREVFFYGVLDEMSYDARKEIVDRNIIEYTKDRYEKMGIQIVGEHDDLFWDVILPEGWDTRATDHTMWNELLDEKGRKRASFFYKAAFYDRDAFTNLEARYTLEVTHNCDPNAEYEVWKKADYIGIIKDAGKIIYSTATYPVVDDYDEETKLKDKLYAELDEYINKEFPNHADPLAYWE